MDALRLMRPVALAILASASCRDKPETGPVSSGPAWAGSYTWRADTVRVCTEGHSHEGYPCTCGPTQHVEGTLTLTSGLDSVPGGDVSLQECTNDASPVCADPVVHPVLPYQSASSGPVPYTITADMLAFCATKCMGLSFASGGGIDFIGIRVRGDTLDGWFQRADGSIRGCGTDRGPFLAVRVE